MEESNVECLPEIAPKNPGRGPVETLSRPIRINQFHTSAPCSPAHGTADSPDKMLNQTRKRVEETVKLSDLTHRLFWLTIVLGVFGVIRYAKMILDFFDHS
jgi:hypothetical protein